MASEQLPVVPSQEEEGHTAGAATAAFDFVCDAAVTSLVLVEQMLYM